MDFIKYPSIENGYKTSWVNKIAATFPNEHFIVQEKIHGANFSLWTNGVEVKCAKRTDFISSSEDFYNADKILEQHYEKMIRLFRYIFKKDCKSIVVFGELFGGCYGHKDVAKDKTAKKINNGVHYHPSNKFIAFDMVVNGEYSNLVVAKEVISWCGIDFINTLESGNLKTCMKFKNEFQSTIYSYYGLPKLEDNLCEGIVIKPIVPLFFSNGNRVIIKSKNNKFTEKNHVKKTYSYNFSKKVTDELDSISAYINYNRVKNVLSKLGEIDESQFGELIKLTIRDAFIEYLEEERIFDSLEKKEQKHIQKNLTRKVSAIIKEKRNEIFTL